ncbi:hypothetical protein RJG79_07200 [Mycoplasmatota bacterium WC44]
MEDKNKLNEVPIAKINDGDINKIKELEAELNNKYYLIAFEK